MLRTIQLTRTDNQVWRLAGIVVFTLLTVASAKLSIEIGAVPFTMQVLVVLLSGMILGSRDGAASQIAYIGLIAIGLPVDARGLGTAAFFGPTGGYLFGFAIAAFVAGWLVEHGAEKVWQRWIAGIVGIAIIYAIGVPVLKIVLGMDWISAWNAGAAPFIIADLAKALIAASLVETGRALLLRNSNLYSNS